MIEILITIILAPIALAAIAATVIFAIGLTKATLQELKKKK